MCEKILKRLTLQQYDLIWDATAVSREYENFNINSLEIGLIPDR